MGQSFEDPSQNNPYNSHYPSFQQNNFTTGSTPVFGNDEPQLNFEDLLRVQEEQGESSRGSASYKPEAIGSGGGGDPYLTRRRSGGSGPPSRQNSGESCRPSSNGGTGLQQQQQQHSSRGSSSSGQLQRRPSKRKSTSEEQLIARLQQEAQRKGLYEEQSQRNLQLQHLARIAAENQQANRQQQYIDPLQHYPGSDYQPSYHNPNPTSEDQLDFRQGEDSKSYLSDQEQQELLQYLNSAGLPSADSTHHQHQPFGYAQTVEAGPSYHPPSLHSAPLTMPNNSYHTHHQGFPQDQFANYRQTHSASVSPQPSPAFRTVQIHEVPLSQDPLVLDSQYRHGPRLSVAGQGQGQGFRGGHQRNRSFGAQSVSSYAGSVHGQGGLETLEGLEDQFAAGLGGGGVAEGYEGSVFGGMRAAGMMGGMGAGGIPQGMPFASAPEFMTSFGPRPGMMAALAGRTARFPQPGRQWSEDDHGASDATAQWRANLKAQTMNDGSDRMIHEEPTVLLINEPMSYDPNQGVEANRYPLAPANNVERPARGSKGNMSEFARRMNSENSDYTLESMTSSAETSRNAPDSGSLVDEQFQREVMNMLRSQMQAADQEMAAPGLAMPPLPVGGAVPPPRGQPQRDQRIQSQATSPQQFIEQVQGQVRSMAPPTFVSSPHFKSAGTFNQTKPHSPPALIIPDNSAPSPKSQPVQMPYPHQRSQDPGPSQLRQHHRPEMMPPPPPVPSLDTTAMQAQIPAQNNMFLGIPSGGNFPMKDSYLSPIGPGGPSINIVPSTPISGLKDGKGIWEKLAMEAQAAQKSDTPQTSGGVGAPSLKNHLESSAEKASRRASHSGNYIQRAPVQLDITTANQALFRLGSAPNTSAYAAESTDEAGRALTAPFLRQRSRSEGQMQNVFSQFDIEAIRQLFGDQGSDDALSVSVHSSGGVSNPSDALPGVDPKMVMAAGFGTTGNYQYDTSNLRGSGGGSDAGQGEQASQEQQGMSDAAAFAALVGGQNGDGGQSSYVITGVDANGTTYILTRDGRRLSFDSRMARNLALMNPASPDFQQTTFHDNSTGEDVYMEHPDPHLGVSKGSFRGRSYSRGVGHARGVRSEDYRSRYDSDMFDDGRSDVSGPGDYLDAPQVAKSSGRSRSGSRSRDTSPYGRRASSPYTKPLSFDVKTEPAARQTLGVDNGAVPPPNATRTRRLSSTSTASDKPPAVVKPVKQRVTSTKTENAAKIRRTSDGLFICPIPGCGSTFTRQFNLKGHIRSHNEERPFLCNFPGCSKAFARQHDCKRHMQLHAGVKPFECEHCHRTFARLDALTRHHKTDSGADCALFRPLPTNPDGSPLSEARYREEIEQRKLAAKVDVKPKREQS